MADQLCALYCVSTPMRRMPELRQFESGKSMMRNLPPNGTAGLARQSREVVQPAAAAAGEHHGEGVLGELGDESLTDGVAVARQCALGHGPVDSTLGRHRPASDVCRTLSRQDRNDPGTFHAPGTARGPPRLKRYAVGADHRWSGHDSGTQVGQAGTQGRHNGPAPARHAGGDPRHRRLRGGRASPTHAERWRPPARTLR